MIHKFKFDGELIVVDVNSGAVHVVDDITWDALDYVGQDPGNWEETKENVVAGLKDRYKREEILDVLSEISELIREGLLFSEDITAEAVPFAEKPVIKSLCLHVAHDCNLRCQYCFAGMGPFGGDKSLMPIEVGLAAIDFLISESGNRRHCEIDFFGGEPLMNMGTVRRVVEYGRDQAAKHNKVFKFTLTTNAVNLDKENIRYLNENDIAVVLSLDGRSMTNDRVRLTPGGKGSYDTIVPNIVRLVESRNNDNYYVRGTYTRFNLDFAADVMHLVDELGLKHVSVEPVVASPDNDYAFREEDLPTLLAEYDKLTRYYMECLNKGKEFDFFHFNLDLEKGPCLPKRLSGCGAGHEYMAVTPDGELFPCHQFVGRDGFAVGDVFDGVREERRPLVETFRQAHVYNKPKCRDCWARFFCSGGCHANAHAFNGTLSEPYALGCELEKKRLECAIYIQVKKMMDS